MMLRSAEILIFINFLKLFHLYLKSNKSFFKETSAGFMKLSHV
jgi:hypothetical protein